MYALLCLLSAAMTSFTFLNLSCMKLAMNSSRKLCGCCEWWQDEAWAAGGSGVLLKSVDGGKTWSRDRAAEKVAANLYSVK